MKKISNLRKRATKHNELDHICPKCQQPNKETFAVCGWCGEMLKKKLV